MASVLTAVSAALLLLGAAACSSSSGGGGEDSGSGGGEAGGSGGDALIEVTSQPEHTGEPISLDIPVHDTGAFEFERWPSACALTDEATVQAVLPNASDIAQQAEPGQMKVITLGEGSNSTHTIPEARCTTSVGFDADGLRLSDGNVVINFVAEVHQAGSPEYIEENADLAGGEEIQIGDATCVSPDPVSYRCVTENVVFTLSIDARMYAQYTDADASIYAVDGEEIDYSADSAGFREMTKEKILEPMVEVAVERLSH